MFQSEISRVKKKLTDNCISSCFTYRPIEHIVITCHFWGKIYAKQQVAHGPTYVDSERGKKISRNMKYITKNNQLMLFILKTRRWQQMISVG
jgi:hypothetical protein